MELEECRCKQSSLLDYFHWDTKKNIITKIWRENTNQGMNYYALMDINKQAPSEGGGEEGKDYN